MGIYKLPPQWKVTLGSTIAGIRNILKVDYWCHYSEVLQLETSPGLQCHALDRGVVSDVIRVHIISYVRSALLAAVLGLVWMADDVTRAIRDLIISGLQKIKASTGKWWVSVVNNPLLCERGNVSLDNALFLLFIGLSVSRPSLSLMYL